MQLIRNLVKTRPVTWTLDWNRTVDYCRPLNVVTSDTYLIDSQRQHADFDNDRVNLVVS